MARLHFSEKVFQYMQESKSKRETMIHYSFAVVGNVYVLSQCNNSNNTAIFGRLTPRTPPHDVMLEQ